MRLAALSIARLILVPVAVAAGLALAGFAAAPEQGAAVHETVTPASGNSDRVISIYWERDALVRQSNIALLGLTKSGERYRASMWQADGLCDVRYSMQWHNVGSWALWCDSGRMASGKFRALGRGQGSFGWGEDERGRPVRYVVHASDGTIENALQEWLEGSAPVWH